MSHLFEREFIARANYDLWLTGIAAASTDRSLGRQLP